VDARYGARALKREVQRRIVLPLAMTLMESAVLPDSILKVTAKEGAIKIRVLETEASRTHRDEREPARDGDGRPATAGDFGASLAKALGRIEELAGALDLPLLATQRDEMLARRNAHDFWKNAARAERIHRELQRIDATFTRLARLRERAEAIRTALAGASGRTALEKLGARVQTLDEAIDSARRELLVLGWEGSADALVEIRPVGGSGREARDLLLGVYTGWAEHRRMTVDLLRDPCAEDEPALVGIKGPYAFGMLRNETGLHRLRLADDGEKPGRVVVAAVRLAQWVEYGEKEKGEAGRPTPRFVAQRALKGASQRGEKVRARLECEGGVVLQSGRTLAENREIAGEIIASWAYALPAGEEVVRRYALAPPLVRDARVGYSSGRPDALAPESFDALLQSVVDTVGKG
jgi:hypothetical protein